MHYPAGMQITDKPLSGKRVLELGTMIAAPFATHILSQLGAEVIKVEPPAGDTTRALVRGGPSGTIVAYSHSKKAICLDLTTGEGREVFRRLAATADMVIHNLAPAAARKLGVTADDCMEVNPGIVHVHIKGYTHGPQADDLMTNPIAEAATGAMDDHRVNDRPTRFGPSYHDQFAGTYAVIRVLSTMLNPAASEADRRIEIGLYETGLHLAARDLAGMQLKTQLLGRLEKEGGGEFSMPGYGSYLTADQRWVYLLILTDAHWAKLTKALDMPEHGDPAYAKLRDRKKDREVVEEAVRKAVAKYQFADVEQRLRAAGLGFNEVMPLERVLEKPQARQPGKLRELEFRGLQFEVPEFPGQTAVEPNLPPPEIGEHTQALLAELGYAPDEIDQLLAGGAAKAYEPGDFAWAPVRQKG
ncbi:crotonobetainyl-CoA:carnitine CoA-transferase CaiB-like acyl-CoA transferase [Novosphingobium chloroacetimidivorans]|uniref:Crotonobetainyl-CoA:carnitine CoA-transferase CaiB-like acyl-CoA transferase n=1 Tax=Novosphingobium chloroacetimidivorans TaxID=1428314 RepID=A0A7W7K9U9_9SPHN|nr:CaiB/BaiF CoA-transferase family protein [Novosphingobium chloroacetimidivorans]MBB4858369.1 crotonobetainyl-CoA:carnitine CoA-transferase CaiB-like acyl-CoA transferase [Novosphingobium chloroacetimidivorans]